MRLVYVINVLCWWSASSIFVHRKQADFSKQLFSYEITYPQKVTSNGNFLSHELYHTLPSSIQRQRRQTSEDLYYKVMLFNREFIIQLDPANKLFGPGMIVERRSSKLNDIHQATVRRLNKESCFFRGSVKNQTNSLVALSTCRGLEGLIRIYSEDLLIEPIKNYERNTSNQHPHMVYKRSSVPSKLGRPSSIDIADGACGTSGNTLSGITERELWEKSQKMLEPASRVKRSVSTERNVEALVVADSMMVDYYSNEDIETYILTLFNMVSSLYHDASIGNAINVVLVRIILLQNDKPGEDLNITHHADQTLKSFCKWQKFINPTDETHPNHHDVAILLTRHNICTKANEPCSTLGLAEVSGMCQPHRSCNVNEDTGLALAFTVAHEMGHNFGMIHDGPQNGCEAQFGERQHIMSPHMNSDSSPLIWSNCSRTEITKFLDRDWGSCLDDEPSQHDFEFPQLPPGAMYDVNHQCRLQYGSAAEFCDGIEDVCQTLWCRHDNKCVTRLEPAAEGTLCAKNKWCYMGQCTIIGERPEAINGEWGAWSSWTECSRPCGAGITSSRRHCDNPPPANGGRYCIGERKRYKVCNTELCEANTTSLRALQCKAYNDVPYKNELFNWVPVSTPLTPCQLHCKPEGKFFSVMLSDTVEDGTPCNPGTKDMCINGKCWSVACDWRINSIAQEDRCGICHGDGTQCQTLRGTFEQKQGLGYVDVVRVPKGARNIRVAEVEEATNYIAIKNEEGEFLLNGQWFIQWSGEYQAAGTTIYYQRDGEKESLHIPGPISEDMDILLLFQGINPGVTYEYTIPRENATRTPEFHWKYTDWTACSATCGGGTQISRPRCMEREAGHVEDTYCNSTSRPEELFRICNKHPCPAKWWAGPWQHCSATCGSSGMRQRTVICVRSLGPDEQLALLNSDCGELEKPIEIEPCHHKHLCPGEADWNINKWTSCSKSCGDGLQFRNVSCKPGQACRLSSKPPSVRPCRVGPCANLTDVPSEISADDVSQNTAIKKSKYHKHRHNHNGEIGHRIRKKYRSGKLANSDRPHGIIKDVVHTVTYMIPIANHLLDEGIEREDSDDIEKEPAVISAEGVKTFGDVDRINFEWRMSDWSQCSQLCKGGFRIRNALCVNTNSERIVVVDLCDPFSKKPTKEVCGYGNCIEWETSNWSQCPSDCDTAGVRYRKVWCPIPKKCNLADKPPDSSQCFSRPCSEWIVGQWSQCSVSCGGGTQLRHVKCVNLTSQSISNECSVAQKPNHQQQCNTEECPESRAELKVCRDQLREDVCVSLHHMCLTWFFKMKCCATCSMHLWKIKKETEAM